MKVNIFNCLYKAWAFLIAQLIKNLPAMQEIPVLFLGQEDLLEKGQATTPMFLGFACDSAVKISACNSRDLGSIPGMGRSPGEGKGYPLQYSGLENSMDYKVYRVAKSQTCLSDFHFHFHTPNIGAPQYIRQMLTSLKGEINSNATIVGNFSIPLTPMDRSTNRKLARKHKL